ncbi:hypothetical protein BEP19_03095 [Ammoniphilus oxalaticus]|uniref:YhfM-like domain-containing protein n=2 Tax=Ammoniphilus oxalaticus TaxID=66863 RepID=A0A419SP95_9BACL|nr:hypothetical protein BEP19_03095 [Ammoniphilus oxalaticus]
MVLLDEPIASVAVSRSNGSGDMNLNLLASFKDEATKAMFKEAITSAKKGVSKFAQTMPDYDVMIKYKGGLPIHAIHLWLGEKNERSVLVYMTEDQEAFLTTSKATNQLRKVLLEEERN